MSRFHADESAALAPINRGNGYVRWHYFLSTFLGATKQSGILLEQGGECYATISEKY
ncbi:Uncharacterised protein [Plesiomonas shigelloides]|nr:Uncharacterised protein [Plesiomonas shigelloides]